MNEKVKEAVRKVREEIVKLEQQESNNQSWIEVGNFDAITTVKITIGHLDYQADFTETVIGREVGFTAIELALESLAKKIDGIDAILISTPTGEATFTTRDGDSSLYWLKRELISAVIVRRKRLGGRYE